MQFLIKTITQKAPDIVFKLSRTQCMDEADSILKQIIPSCTKIETIPLNGTKGKGDLRVHLTL